MWMIEDRNDEEPPSQSEPRPGTYDTSRYVAPTIVNAITSRSNTV